ncbi:MAG: aldo/keto reductase [Rhodobacteraceae bacterium]|nr:aldo/keto reductase [Paracoccaceae bacterium]
MTNTIGGAARIPLLGFGTYGRQGEAGVTAMLAAMEAGCRHLDTAQSYGTEAETGEALRQCGLPRDQVFVTTKIDMPNYGPGLLIPSLERSIETIGVGAPNLTLLHWPSPKEEVALEVYVEQIARAKSDGLTAHIGVSNFPVALLQRAQELLGKDEISCNQVELSPLFKNKILADYCDSVGISIVCYQPIAKGAVSQNATIAAIAKTHGATGEQVALAWELAKGYGAIPTTSQPARAAANFAALKLQLSADEIARIDALPDRARAIAPEWGPDWD